MSRTRGVEVYPGIIKLDPSAPYFVQSRTLEVTLSVPVKTVPKFIAYAKYAKANPGKLN
jgi:hypothetical protein